MTPSVAALAVNVVVGEINEQLWWYVARSSGIVSWAMVTLSVVWGLVCSTRLATGRTAASWLLDLHRFLGALSITFLGVHLVALVADGYVDFGAVEILVPGASEWNPAAVAWGVVAMYLLVAVEVSSLAMRRIPRRLWRVVHTSAFAVYVLATVHTITAGTDRSNPILRWTAVASVQLVLLLVVVRVVTTRRLKRALRPAPSRVHEATASKARRATTSEDRRSGGAASRRPGGPAVDTRPSPGEPAHAGGADPALAERLDALRRRRDRAPDPARRHDDDPPASPLDPDLATRIEALQRRETNASSAAGRA